MIETLPGKPEYAAIQVRIKCGNCGQGFTLDQSFKCPGCGKMPTEGARNAVKEALAAFGDAEYRMEYDRRQGRPSFALVDMKIIR